MSLACAEKQHAGAAMPQIVNSGAKPALPQRGELTGIQYFA
jgi:hypothetical protein